MHCHINKKSYVKGTIGEDLYVVETGENDDGVKIFSAVDKTGKILIDSVNSGYFEARGISVHPFEGDKTLGDYIPDYNNSVVQDALIGFAVGDAYGVPYEFVSRSEIMNYELGGMIGKDTGVPFDSRWGNIIPSGAWSDDTSMLIASMDSIVKNNGEILYDDIMQKFLNWWEKGEYTSLDTPFGLGSNVSASLDRYKKGTPALEAGGKMKSDNGNGALMRILPFSLYCISKNLNMDDTVDLINKASGLTHGHNISKMCCFMYTELLREAIRTKDVTRAFTAMTSLPLEKYYSIYNIESLGSLRTSRFYFTKESDINESGYVVDTLQAVMYSLLQSNNYEDSIKTAVRLGYDTDTNAGLTGAVAGIIYGKESIPEEWLSKLRKRDLLESLADSYQKLYDKWAVS